MFVYVDEWSGMNKKVSVVFVCMGNMDAKGSKANGCKGCVRVHH